MVLLNFEFRVFFLFGINLQQLGNLAVNKMHVNVYNNARIKFSKFSESKIISPPFLLLLPPIYIWIRVGKKIAFRQRWKCTKQGHTKNRAIETQLTQKKKRFHSSSTRIWRVRICGKFSSGTPADMSHDHWLIVYTKTKHFRLSVWSWCNECRTAKESSWEWRAHAESCRVFRIFHKRDLAEKCGNSMITVKPIWKRTPHKLLWIIISAHFSNHFSIDAYRIRRHTALVFSQRFANKETELFCSQHEYG